MMIKDEILGNIELNDLETRIIDSPDFQRLRKIKQMAFTYLVYPGANHTRFEHSLGVMHLASKACAKFGFSKDTTEKVRLFALLHDIGHVAYSHELEKVLKKYCGTHEEIGRKRIMDGEIRDLLDQNYGAKKILDIENSVEGKVVTSDLGVDRMDYLVRDAENTGVAYGIIDADRILHTMLLRKKELAITEGGLEAAESLLVARFMMFSTVYLHKTVRIAAAMFQRGFQLAVESGELDPEEFLNVGDEEALALLKETDSSSDYSKRLTNRNLYKEAYSLERDRFIELKDDVEELEEELSEKAGCDVILEYPTGFFKPVDFKVVMDSGHVAPISEVSDLVRALKVSEERRRRLLVLCPAEKREKVRKLAERLL
jgi:HD superfamily phosphohydrolase